MTQIDGQLVDHHRALLVLLANNGAKRICLMDERVFVEWDQLAFEWPFNAICSLVQLNHPTNFEIYLDQVKGPQKVSIVCPLHC